MPTDIARFLAQAARAAPSADNSQPLDFAWDGHRFSVAFSSARGEGRLFGPTAHATLLAVGACLENIDAALAAIGIEGRWDLADSPGLSGHPYAQLSLDHFPSAPLLAASLPLFNRHTNRFPFKKSPIPAELLAKIEGLRRDGARLRIVRDPGDREAVLRSVRVASEARFCTQELHDWLAGSLRFTPAQIDSGEGIDVRTVHLPPGGSLLLRFIADWKRMRWLNRFGAFKMFAIVETALLKDAPGLICIVGSMAPAGVIAAGRLLCRVWSDLNAMGLAVHPYYVTTDQLLRLQSKKVPAAMVERIRTIARTLPQRLTTAPDESLHMILRVGFPCVQPQASKRLPLATVYKDTSRVRDA